MGTPQEVVVGQVRDFAARGEGVVAADDGRIVLVPGTYPGDRVDVVLAGQRRGVSTGRLRRVMEPSSDRVVPACALATDRCGGCSWMSLDLAKQHDEKRRRVARAAGLTDEDVELVAAPGDLAYRRRARLHWSAGPRGSRLGYRSPRARGLVDVPSCPVLAPALASGLAAFRRDWLPHLEGSGTLRLAMGRGDRAVASVGSDVPQPPAAYQAAARLADPGGADLAGAVLTVEGVATSWGTPDELTLGADGLPLEGAPGGFSQAQDAVNLELVRRVRALSSVAGGTVLELYAGQGNITVALAPEASRMVTGELDPDATGAARRNLARRSFDHVRVVEGDALDVIKGHGRFGGHAPDVVVLDPPRKGAGPEVMGAVAALRPSRIVLVSCEPVSLARDVGVLREQGRAVRSATAFDMFPHTPHVEAVVLLS